MRLHDAVSLVRQGHYSHTVQNSSCDVCSTQQDVDDCFALFLGRLQCGGVLLANGDDEGCRRVVNQAAAYNGIVTWQDFVGMGSQERACSKLVLFYGFSKFNDISLHAADPVLDQQASSRSHNAPWFSATRMMWAIPEYRHEPSS